MLSVKQVLLNIVDKSVRLTPVFRLRKDELCMLAIVNTVPEKADREIMHVVKIQNLLSHPDDIKHACEFTITHPDEIPTSDGRVCYPDDLKVGVYIIRVT